MQWFICVDLLPVNLYGFVIQTKSYIKQIMPNLTKSCKLILIESVNKTSFDEFAD